MKNCFHQSLARRDAENNRIKRVECLIKSHDILYGYTVSCIVHTQSNMISKFTHYFAKELDAQNMFNYLNKFESKQGE